MPPLAALGRLRSAVGRHTPRASRARVPAARAIPSYDVKWIEVCADEVEKFKGQQGSKPLIILFKMGLEVARMDKGANGNELQRLLSAHSGEKKSA